MWPISLIYHLPGWHRWWLLIGFVIIMATGCASTSLIPAKTDSADCEAQIHPDPQITETTTTNDLVIVEQRLRSEVRKWEGTPHQMGGTTRQGIDCSGFVQRLYRDPLKTSWGTMEGSYRMLGEDGDTFDAAVGRFWLTTEQRDQAVQQGEERVSP